MTLYEIVEAQPMPQFDPNRTVKSVLLSPVNARRATKLMRTYGMWVSLGYFVGSMLFPVVLFAPTSVAQYVAVLETVLETPACIMVFLLLRADLVVLVVKSYDYWFFSIATVVFTCSFSVLLRDARAVLLAARWLSFHVPILIDANMTHATPLIRGVLMSAVLSAIALVAMSLDLIPDTLDERELNSNDTKARTIDRQSHMALSVRDMVMNSLVTMSVLLLRIVIRKRAIARSSSSSSTRPDRQSLPPSAATRISEPATTRTFASVSGSASARTAVAVPRVVKCVTLRCSIVTEVRRLGFVVVAEVGG